MTKIEEINNPNSCLNKGLDTELKFVIRETDIVAPEIVREWCRLRILKGRNNQHDAQITEAMRWADLVEYRRERKKDG
jgi:hypothetical protein